MRMFLSMPTDPRGEKRGADAVITMDGSSFPYSKRRRRHQNNRHRLLSIGEDTASFDVEGGEDLISHLPDECVQIIFSFLPSSRDRCTCAAVSKKWLLLLAHMRGCEFKSLLRITNTASKPTATADAATSSRCLEAREANDARVAAMAVGTYAKRLLSGLSLRGGLDDPSSTFSHHQLVITDAGLQIVSQSFPNLRSLAMWNCLKVTSLGLASIAASCPSLEKLDVSNCSGIDDAGLIHVARSCPNLSSLVLESCPLLGNDALEGFARFSIRLESVSIAKCPLVGSAGVVAVISLLSNLARVRLSQLCVGDGVLEAIDRSSSIKTLCLENLAGITPAGFSWIGAAAKLELLSVRSCAGFTDASFGSVGMGSSNFSGLKHVDIKSCGRLTDAALARLTESTRVLQTLKLQRCDGITTRGLLVALRNCGRSLKVLSLVRCSAIGGVFDEDDSMQQEEESSSTFHPQLESLTLKKCNAVRDDFLSTISPCCDRARHIGLICLPSVTDRGVANLLRSTSPLSTTARVSLSGCAGITDWSVLSLARAFGGRLRSLSLEGCTGLSDRSLDLIGRFCTGLAELDVSGCGISDDGVTRLATAAGNKGLEVLSLAGCAGITDESLRWLEVACVGLVGLNLKRCRGVSTAGVDSVRSTLWWCDLLY